MKAKYPNLKAITIESQYPKLPAITIGKSVHVPSSTSTTTHKRRKRNANSIITIPRPAKGCIYTDEEQWNIIKKYPKGSPERSEVIRLMTQEHYVKSRATLYRHIKKSEDDERVKLTQQLKPSHTPQHLAASHLGLGFNGDYIRPNIREVVNWKGRLFLTVIPVSFAESKDMDSLDMSRSHYIDICKVIGNSDRVELCSSDEWNCIQGKKSSKPPYPLHFIKLCQEKRILPLKWVKLLPEEKQHRITKLYFPPYKYPPSSDTAEHKTILGHLRNYIKTQASFGELPVVCSGDNDQQRRFRCQHMYKRRMQPEYEKEDHQNWHPYNMYSCTFTFVIRWDKYGYYIPLLENPDQDGNLGCAWHCCEKD